MIIIVMIKITYNKSKAIMIVIVVHMRIVMIMVMIMIMNYNDNNNYNDIFTKKHNSLYNNDEDIDHAITISLIIIMIYQHQVYHNTTQS